MDRPYIICNMVTSLDGKVTGDFLGRDAHSGLIEEYYRIHREYGADGFLCGRVTMEGSFPQPLVPPTVYEGPSIERKYQANNTMAASFRLKEVKKLDDGGLWLTYQKQL
ncbi:dihydrofolate reductase family protein [Paradesulfitobacterium ferrireducens]|uniref:hypothetical protein n=1 Tax=Paradesulfitobacterium ferrireducens TaxID=2816476 RepID=UPI001A8DDBFC|nr:hypothetical protein [Paradesulfitobacterium ferrireducens]